jgi:hypothetical protein
MVLHRQLSAAGMTSHAPFLSLEVSVYLSRGVSELRPKRLMYSAVRQI